MNAQTDLIYTRDYWRGLLHVESATIQMLRLADIALDKTSANAPKTTADKAPPRDQQLPHDSNTKPLHGRPTAATDTQQPLDLTFLLILDSP